MNEDQQHKELVSTARITGAWYLMLAIAGMVGFLTLHTQIYINDDPARTLNNLTEQNTIARIRLILELLIILSQALAAVWFYKLFKDLRPVAAWALAAWGMMNSGVIMISAIAMGGAINVAAGAAAPDDTVIMITIFSQVISNAWAVGGLFFGLWLIPMGYVVVSSKCMPLWLGRILIIGGAGYLVITFLTYMGMTDAWVGLLVIPATVGEFWMIAYLLIFGIRPISVMESNPR